MTLAVLAFIVALASSHAVAAEPLSTQEGEKLFLTQVQPILKRACLGCHGDGTELEGGFDLRTRAGLLKGGDSGTPAVVPGESADSPLYVAVTWTDETKMPPQERNRLSAAEVTAIRDWIDAGAPWPTATAAAPAVSTKKKWDYKPEDVWAFEPVKRVSVPKADPAAGPIFNEIDYFVHDKLHAKGLTPAAPADPVTLIRRITIDLTGLPPTPEDVADFVRAYSRTPAPLHSRDSGAGAREYGGTGEEAYAALIDRLLSSPRYGEQQARHWLDVVRYADTAGFSNDFDRPHAWRFRDYVIRSFNADKPYNRFIVEQLAGDELDESEPELAIATGFLRMGPWEHTGMSVAAITRQFFLDDVTDSVGNTFLGLGLRCASCHDHKFDPIPTRDYYRLQAVFAPVTFVERPVPFLPNENTAGIDAATASTRQHLAKAEAAMKLLTDKQNKAIAALLKEKGVKSVKELPENERPNKRDFGYTPEDMGMWKVFNKQIQLRKLEAQRGEPKAFSVTSAGTKHDEPVQDVCVLVGGSLASPAAEVTPGVLSAVAGSDDAAQPTAWNTIPESALGRRLALANWIASPTNPLTARVMVNRIWQQHFGRGLVETSNNFGKMGRRPTHPELLDWLANYFVEHGWSVKAMHRLILRSAAYQRGPEPFDAKKTATLDPQNHLLGHFPPRRLTAEELRDHLLAVSGELNLTAGGPSVFPEINEEAALQPRHVMGSMASAYEPSKTRAERNRRTIYTHQMRTLVNPMLEVFNVAGSDKSCERRDATTVTPQVFSLFNGQSVHDSALAMARRLEELSSDTPGRIDQAYRLCFSRAPTDAERKLCLAHVERMLEHHRQVKPVVIKRPDSVTRTMVEELTGEPFSFVEQLDVSNYEPNLKPWDMPAETRALAELCLVLMNSNEFIYVY